MIIKAGNPFGAYTSIYSSKGDTIAGATTEFLTGNNRLRHLQTNAECAYMLIVIFSFKFGIECKIFSGTTN